jgi:hypothetical protein
VNWVSAFGVLLRSFEIRHLQHVDEVSSGWSFARTRLARFRCHTVEMSQLTYHKLISDVESPTIERTFTLFATICAIDCVASYKNQSVYAKDHHVPSILI